MHREGHSLIIPRKNSLFVGPRPAYVYLPPVSTRDHDARGGRLLGDQLSEKAGAGLVEHCPLSPAGVEKSVGSSLGSKSRFPFHLQIAGVVSMFQNESLVWFLVVSGGAVPPLPFPQPREWSGLAPLGARRFPLSLSLWPSSAESQGARWDVRDRCCLKKW